MEQRTDPPSNLIKLDANRERAVFWYSIVVMLCLAGAAIGVSLLLQVTRKSLDQVSELGERARSAQAPSPSEPPKT